MSKYIEEAYALRVLTDQTLEQFAKSWSALITLLGGHYEIVKYPDGSIDGVCTIGEDVVAAIECHPYNPLRPGPDYGRFGISKTSIRCRMYHLKSVVRRLMIEWLNDNTCDAVYGENERIRFVQVDGELIFETDYLKILDPNGEYLTRSYNEADLSSFEISER